MRTEKIEYVSEEDYLRLEAQSPARHEYVAGTLYAMTGATLRHNVIALNLASACRSHLKASPCRVFIESVKLHVSRDSAYYYPDIIVSCDPRLDSLGARDMAVDQAVVLIEVLSDSTEGIDRREKLNAYRKLASLKEYVLVSQDTLQVEVFRRSGEVGWQHFVLQRGDELELTSIELRLPVVDIYESVGL